MKKLFHWRLFLLLVPGFFTIINVNAAPAKITVAVDRPVHTIPPTLWGIFFEDINLSADGGIYPELVRNRSFEDSEKPENWTLEAAPSAVPEMVTDTSKPLNPFNRRCLRLRLDGPAKLLNEGYWGMNVVKGERYRFSVAARAGDGLIGPLRVALLAWGKELAGGEFNGLNGEWKTYTCELIPVESSPKALLQLSFSGKGTLFLDMASLLPLKTWKNHGLRPDLCEMLQAMKPSFMRFPGGCWVEGDDVAHMYRWKDTIGDVSERKPLYNIWGYHATHGLGFHEYLQLAEDLCAEPLFDINCGMSHKETVPLSQMGQWVQDALDALEYANGATNSVWGALRAGAGHPEPFNLKYLEIGNENGGPAYNERWALFHAAIKARHPEVQLIANVWHGAPTHPMPDILDEHYYNTPEFFMREAHRYDTYDRSAPKVFVGEYAVTRNCGKGNLRAAIGEAAFMTGIERNCDIVTMACYAPLFVNVNHRKWNPDLINFDSSRVYGLPGYYVQKLFSEHRGTRTLPITIEEHGTERPPLAGAVGVGTWRTAAEFKDIKVTGADGNVLFASDFSNGTEGWEFLGGGEWHTRDGVLAQSSQKEFIRAIVGDKRWANYTLELKARKTSGDEGFLILFAVTNDEEHRWWNLGGWGNRRHAIELGGVQDERNGRIETGKWYDIKIQLQGLNVRCHLNGRLVHDYTTRPPRDLYASATLDENHRQLIVKVVNTAASDLSVEIELKNSPPLSRQARAILFTSRNPEDENTLEEPTKVSPVINTIEIPNERFTYSFPGNSLTILRLSGGR